MFDHDDEEERLFRFFIHFSALSAYVLFPLGHVIFPGILWAYKHREYPGLDEPGRQALNFNLSFTFYLFVAGMIALIGMEMEGTLGLKIVGALMFFSLVTIHVSQILLAAFRAYNGEHFHYPFAIRFLKVLGTDRAKIEDEDQDSSS